MSDLGAAPRRQTCALPAPGHYRSAINSAPVTASAAVQVWRGAVPFDQRRCMAMPRRYDADADREWDHGLTYVFGLSDGTVIDGSEGGNDSRHLNHSCEPNCAAYEIEREDGSLAIVIETVRSVRRGEELLLDYALDVGQADESDFPCCCGVSTCRGTMVAV